MLESRPAAAQRILVGTAATLTSFKRDQYGDTANPGTTTVTVTRGDGTVIATAAATTEDSANQVSHTLTAADNTQLDWLTAVWTDTGDSTTWTSFHEVVGGFYASVNEIRTRDPNLTVDKYLSATIRSALEEIEVAMETECGRSFVPRYRRVRLAGNDRGSLILPDVDIRTVRTARVYSDWQTYTSLTGTELSNLTWTSSGALSSSDGWWWPAYFGTANYVIEYEHGMDRPPVDVVAAAIRWLRATLNASKSGIPDRATSFSVNDGGSYSLIVPGRNGAVSGIPEVDLVIDRYRVQRFTVGV